jgi:competence protein ComEA
VLAVGLGGYWLLRAPATPVEAGLPMAPGAAGQSVPPTSALSPDLAPVGTIAAAAASTTVAVVVPDTIVVHVAGAVVAPGVYRLPAAARVVDALTAAGGAAPMARTDAVNLAAAVHDGDRVYVPTVDEVPSVPAGVSGTAAPDGVAASAPSGPVDVNTATVDELDGLPGVGPATAAAIVAYRDSNGPFASVEGLADVRGIGPAKLEAIRSLVTT